jgi:inosose dehydratase
MELKRRDFLALTAAVPAAGASLWTAWARPLGAQSSPTQKFRIGHNLTTYISGDRGPEGFWHGVEEIASLGVRGTEADNRPSRLSATYGDSPSVVRDRLTGHNMKFVALYYNPTTGFNIPLADPAAYEQNLEQGMAIGKFVKEIGGDILNLAGGVRPQPDPAPEFRALARLVNELGKRLLNEFGLRLGIHPHRGHLVETQEEIARAMEMTRPEYFSLCPDTGHLLAAGADPLDVFRTYRSRIIYMHYKDYSANLLTAPSAETGRRGGFVELGKGNIDFPAITEVLLTTGYDGWVMIELDRAPAAPIDAVRANLRYMTDTLGLKVG